MSVESLAVTIGLLLELIALGAAVQAVLGAALELKKSPLPEDE